MRDRWLPAACIAVLVGASPTWLACAGSALVTAEPSLGRVLPGGELEIAAEAWNVNGTSYGPGCILIHVAMHPPAEDRHGLGGETALCPGLFSGRVRSHLVLKDATSEATVSYSNGTAWVEQLAQVHAAWGNRAYLEIYTDGNPRHPFVRVPPAVAVPGDALTFWLVAIEGTGICLALAALALRLRARWVGWPLAAAWVLMPAASPDGPDAHVPFVFLLAATGLALAALFRRRPVAPKAPEPSP